ncbi:MAG: hypothetical protein QM756_44475 [Polyangiaceae bacterium]
MHAGALRDDVTVLQGAPHSLAQVVAFTFRALLQAFDFGESARVGDSNGRVIGEHPQPIQVRLLEPATAEKRHHSEHLAAEAQRLSGEALNLLGQSPLWLDNPVAGPTVQQQGPVTGGDVPHLSVAQQDFAVRPVDAIPAPIGIDDRGADAGLQLQIRFLAFDVTQQPHAR